MPGEVEDRLRIKQWQEAVNGEWVDIDDTPEEFDNVSKEYYKTSVVTHIVMSRLDSNSPFRFIY